MELTELPGAQQHDANGSAKQLLEFSKGQNYSWVSCPLHRPTEKRSRGGKAFQESRSCWRDSTSRVLLLRTSMSRLVRVLEHHLPANKSTRYFLKQTSLVGHLPQVGNLLCNRDEDKTLWIHARLFRVFQDAMCQSPSFIWKEKAARNIWCFWNPFQVPIVPEWD